MQYGAHLPLMDFGGHEFGLDGLVEYTNTAADLGFDLLAANDHLVFSTGWLDGPTALAAMVEHSGSMMLATTVALPVVRGPVPLAKTLGAIDRLSRGRLVVGVGPGSSPVDYGAVGVDFAERWERFDDAVLALGALLREDVAAHVGPHYSTEGVVLRPAPRRAPPVWIGSWGSDAGLRRVARLADGWLASAYNTTPPTFADAWSSLQARLVAVDRDPQLFPNTLATMWCYITDDDTEARRVLEERVAPVVHRPVDVLRERLAIGPAERVAELLTAFAQGGLQRVVVWPVLDEAVQLRRFWHEVRPLVESG